MESNILQNNISTGNGDDDDNEARGPIRTNQTAD